MNCYSIASTAVHVLQLCLHVMHLLTGKRISFDCVDLIESRNRHFNVNNSKELFEKVPPDSILSYLHGIGLFYRLSNILRI